MSTIALCVPAYNAAWCLPRLLESANHQIMPFDEILVYDDCSMDSTKEVAAKYGATILHGNQNMGCSYGKNELAKFAKSEWLHFHDADDELLPNFTTLSHKWIQEGKTDVVLFSYEYRDNITKELYNIRSFNSQMLSEDPLKYAISEQINPFCGLYNKKKFLQAGGFDCDPNVLYNEDCAMHINLALKHLTFASEDEVAIINYYVKDSMSQKNFLKCAKARYYVLEKVVKTHASIYPRELSKQLWDCAMFLAVGQDWKYVRKTIHLIKLTKVNHSKSHSILFDSLSTIDPFFALWIREKLIRLFKPKYRRYG